MIFIWSFSLKASSVYVVLKFLIIDDGPYGDLVKYLELFDLGWMKLPWSVSLLFSIGVLSRMLNFSFICSGVRSKWATEVVYWFESVCFCLPPLSLEEPIPSAEPKINHSLDHWNFSKPTLILILLLDKFIVFLN